VDHAGAWSASSFRALAGTSGWWRGRRDRTRNLGLDCVQVFSNEASDQGTLLESLSPAVGVESLGLPLAQQDRDPDRFSRWHGAPPAHPSSNMPLGQVRRSPLKSTLLRMPRHCKWNCLLPSAERGASLSADGRQTMLACADYPTQPESLSVFRPLCRHALRMAQLDSQRRPVDLLAASLSRRCHRPASGGWLHETAPAIR
jgi:hypothetical protein